MPRSYAEPRGTGSSLTLNEIRTLGLPPPTTPSRSSSSPTPSFLFRPETARSQRGTGGSNLICSTGESHELEHSGRSLDLTVSEGDARCSFNRAPRWVLVQCSLSLPPCPTVLLLRRRRPALSSLNRRRSSERDTPW